MTVNKITNTFLTKVEEVNPGNMDELKTLKMELNNELYNFSKKRLYTRIYTTLKKDGGSIKSDRENKLRVRQLVIAIAKVEELITENRNIILLQQNKQKERLNKGNK